jgi:hypothetical protein
MTTYVVTDYGGCDYITAGKRYEAQRDEALFKITNDKGETNTIFGPNCAHLNGNSWTVIEEPDTPKTWGEMTDAEKGALLLAIHRGAETQYMNADEDFWRDHHNGRSFYDLDSYRIKPEPVVGEVVLYGSDYGKEGFGFAFDGGLLERSDTHTLTLPTLDGNLVTGEFANEDGMKVVIEEKQK